MVIQTLCLLKQKSFSTFAFHPEKYLYTSVARVFLDGRSKFGFNCLLYCWKPSFSTKLKGNSSIIINLARAFLHASLSKTWDLDSYMKLFDFHPQMCSNNQDNATNDSVIY